MIDMYDCQPNAIFKIFKISVNKWTAPTTVLGGLVLISSLILVMN